MSEQKAMGYHSAQEMLAERFHMDEDLLKSLNPQADFSKAGNSDRRGEMRSTTPCREVASIDVSKPREQVIAYGEGSQGAGRCSRPRSGPTERPSPKGVYKVKGVAQHPDYTYDPSKLTWGPKKAGKLHIPPGPNGLGSGSSGSP